MKIQALFAAAALALSANVVSADPAAAITAAEDARKAAAEVGYEWRDTAKMIKEAQAALDAGDKDKAMKLADAAKLQGEMGLKQAEVAKNAGPRF